MGVTGEAKSTFISILGGDELQLCKHRTFHDHRKSVPNHAIKAQQKVKVFLYAFMYSPTQRDYFINMPGFNDTNRSDAEIFKDTATVMSRMYAGNIKLAGVIYLRRITDNRMSSYAYVINVCSRNLAATSISRRLFQELLYGSSYNPRHKV
jgi:hypothetical protein